MGLTVKIEGADVLISEFHGENGEITKAYITCNKKAEDSLWTFAIRTLTQKGIEIGYVRTCFGFTIYADTDAKRELVNAHIKSKKFTTWHGNI